MKKYAFVNRIDMCITDSGLSFQAIRMYAYMVRMLANERMNICDEFDLALSLTSNPAQPVEKELVDKTIKELLENNWIVEITEQ